MSDLQESGTRPAGPRPFVDTARHRPVPSRARRSYSPAAMWRRRWSVRVLKYLLPVGALALLSVIVLWPEFEGVEERARMSFRRMGRAAPDAVRVVEPRYQGVDSLGRPYNVTAAVATQTGDSAPVNLDGPRADLFLNGGRWLLIESRTGVYERAADRLNMNGEVTLWHDNGTLIVTEEARVDVKGGNAEGDQPVAAQGSFGTLTGDGFRLRDRGAVVIFTGNARAMLEGSR